MKKSDIMRMFQEEKQSLYGFDGEYETDCVTMEDIEKVVDKILSGDIPDYDEIDRVKAQEEKEWQDKEDARRKEAEANGFMYIPSGMYFLSACSVVSITSYNKDINK